MTRRDAVLAAAALLFIGAYYMLRASVGNVWWAELSYLFVPGAAAALCVARARRSVGRAVVFWNLLAAGLALWIAGEISWTLALLRGLDPRVSDDTQLGFLVPPDALFVGFLVPMLAALSLRPHPRPARRDVLAFVDVGLLWIALAFVFVRLVLVPRRQPLGLREALLAGLSFLLAAWGAALWRCVEERGWRRIYGLVAAFGVSYGAMSAGANGWGGAMPPPGGLADLAWIAPFVLLVAAGLGIEALPASSSEGRLVFVAGAGPFVLDLLLDAFLPEAAGAGHATHLGQLIPATAALSLGAALRLRVQEAADTRARSEARARTEEQQRAARLEALAALTASLIAEIRGSLEHVVACAQEAAGIIGEKGARVVAQAQRALTTVQELSGALRLAHPAPRVALDVGALLAETVQRAIDEGLGLQVVLEGTSALPRVAGDPATLRAAFGHLLRNAAQASPGGMLRISGELNGSDLLLRFKDDGPGVAEELRTRIFDPFFTTRRVGEGTGLGLTLVHFVARDHGGSVVLAASKAGACFVVRLPALGRPAASERPRWAFAAAVVIATAMATTLSVVPTRQVESWGTVFHAGAAAAAALAMLANAVRRRDAAARLFWVLLAVGPLAWGGAHLLEDGGAAAALEIIGDLGWIAALLLRPERGALGARPRTSMAGAATAFLLIAYFDVYLFMLPGLLAGEPRSGGAVLGRGLLLLGLAAWSASLAWRAQRHDWQDVYARVSVAFGAWAFGHSLASAAGPGSLAGLGDCVAFLMLAALALSGSRATAEEAQPAAPVLALPFWTPAAIATLALIPVFEAAFGGPTGFPVLDAARSLLSRATLVLAGLALVLHEVLAHREEAATRMQLQGARAQLVSAERRSRLLALVGGAIHELAGHLSGVRALTRLLLAHTDLPSRVRGDTERIQANSEAAARIVRNLLPMIRRAPEALTFVSPNDVVREVLAARQADLAQEGIRLHAELGREVIPAPLDGPALEQVLLGLIDNAAVAIRRLGREGEVELSTRLAGRHVVLLVRDDGPGLNDAARRRLSGPLFGGGATWTGPGLGLHTAREVVAQHGGSIVGRERLGGGAEIEIRLPVLPAASESAG